MAYTTTDASALHQYLQSKQVDGLSDLKTGSDGSRWFHSKDPEGNEVQVIQTGRKLTATLASDSAISIRVIHVGYLVHDRKAEDHLYKDSLGFRAY